MFCTYCKAARPTNEAPCPNCGAPSSHLGQSLDGGWGMAEPASMMQGSTTNTRNQQWNYQEPQLSFESPTPPWQQNSPVLQSSFDTPAAAWPQKLDFPDQSSPPQQSWGTPATAPRQENQQAAQLIPYTGNAQAGYPQSSMQLVPRRDQEQMLPALPAEQDAPTTVYIPPMYTKPRPIIPLYRIISGFLSILLVTGLLCAGSIYYANSTGKLAGIQRMFGAAPAPLANPVAAQIPDPPDKVDLDKASGIITAATTTLHVDPKSKTPREQDKILQIGVPFYITFTVQPPKSGYVIVKWYMNGNYYQTTTSDLLTNPVNGDLSMVYTVPAESTAELYWMSQGEQPQLAQRLYFAVR